MPGIALQDLLDFGLSYVLAFVLISCFLWYFFRVRPAEESEKQKALNEMVRQGALCARAVESVAKCMEQNTRATQGVQEALEVVARQESVLLEMQRRLYADIVSCKAQGSGVSEEKTN